METNWLGIVPYTDVCVVVHAELSPRSPNALEVKADIDWAIDVHNRALSYDTVYWKMREYITHNGITAVVLKAGAFGPDGRARGSLIASSELRGVLLAATNRICPVRLMNKANITRNYGLKSFNEYVRDTSFWVDHITGDLRKTSREAAMFLIAARAL